MRIKCKLLGVVACIVVATLLLSGCSLMFRIVGAFLPEYEPAVYRSNISIVDKYILEVQYPSGQSSFFLVVTYQFTNPLEDSAALRHLCNEHVTYMGEDGVEVVLSSGGGVGLPRETRSYAEPNETMETIGCYSIQKRIAPDNWSDWIDLGPGDITIRIFEVNYVRTDTTKEPVLEESIRFTGEADEIVVLSNDD